MRERGKMTRLLSFQHFLMLSVFTGAANAYYFHTWIQCIYTSTDLSDMELIESYCFNKYPVIKFNSTVGMFEGFSEFGVKTAETWNNDTNVLQQTKAKLETYCKPNAKVFEVAIYNKKERPTVKLSSVMPGDTTHPALVKCSVYDFYPPPIKVYWLKDGVDVTFDVTSTEELLNGDWYHQIHSTLEYTPKSAEKISCVVEHSSFSRPMIYDWTPPAPELEWDVQLLFIMECAALMLGIIIAAAGYIYYKIKTSPL